MVKYSICTTTYNIRSKIKKSLDSILPYIDEKDWEVVIVDSKSTDGTVDILNKYKKIYKNFKVIEKKCKRGLGRQIAYKNSKGKYIIAVDLDTVYYPTWFSFIEIYENIPNHEKFALHAPYLGIYPRQLVEKVGGWRNLQWGEDFDLWYRLLRINAFKWTPVVLGQNWILEEKERRQTNNILKIIFRKLISEKDRFIARSEYSLKDRIDEIKGWSSKPNLYLFWMPLTFVAYVISLPFREKRDPKDVCRMWYRNLLQINLEEHETLEFISFPPSIRSYCYEEAKRWH